MMRSRTVAVVAAAVALGAMAGVSMAQGPWTAPKEAAGVANPVKGTGAVKTAIETNCVTCHGGGGKGDGAAASALPTKPADWTSETVQKQTDGELFWKISNGRGPMPPWKHLPEKARWEMVNYIRSLKK